MSSCISINNAEYCEHTRNVDDMLSRFKFDREQIINLLITDYKNLIFILWSEQSPISVDRDCLCNMGQRIYNTNIEDRLNGKIIPNETLSNFYMCSQCRNMSRIIKLSKSSINNPFYIECGNSAGKMLILTKIHIDNLFIGITHFPSLNLISIIKDNPLISICEPKIKSYNSSISNNMVDYIGSDSYTNQILITWYLDYELSKLGLPHICRMYTSFICGDDAYCLYENPDIGYICDFKKYPNLLNEQPTSISLKSEIASEIIKQLFVTLHSLNKYDFSHGAPSSKSIIFSYEPCSYSYNNIYIDSPITLKLCNLSNSGITIKSIDKSPSMYRLYSKSIVADEEMKKIPFKTLVDIISLSLPGEDINFLEKVTIYRLKNISNNLKESILYMYLKHLGVPLFQSSFDIYAFMVVLMSDYPFYSAVVSDKKLYALWKSLWLPQEFIQVSSRIKLLHAQPNSTSEFYKVFNFISDFGLRCNILSSCWSQIQSW